MATNIKNKAAKIAETKDKRPRATAKYVRMSADKARIVLDVIRGMDYTNASAVLKNTPKAASPIILKVLESAAANAENNMNMSKRDLFVAVAFADVGPTLKRFAARAKGSGARILKRTCHITLVLDDIANKKVEEVQ